jgi:hypothetical protein
MVPENNHQKIFGRLVYFMAGPVSLRPQAVMKRALHAIRIPNPPFDAMQTGRFDSKIFFARRSYLRAS